MKHTFFRTILLVAMTFSINLPMANAENTKAYKEQEFLNQFSGKSTKVVIEALGKPYKKDYSIKPSNVDQVLSDKDVQISSKNDHIEMWYYKLQVNYAPNKFFNTAELTFTNDKCVNITFANKKN